MEVPRLNKLGSHAVTVSGVSLGSARFFHEPRFRCFRERRELLELALDLGINFFDSADSYACGLDELFLGRVFRGRRQHVVIATKAGYRGSVFAKACFKLTGISGQQCFEPAYLRRSAERSLGRLKTDYVDVFYLHNPPREIRLATEAYEALQQLKSEGKIRLAGVSCARSTDFFDLVHEAVDVVQVPLDRHYTQLGQLSSRCRELGIGFVLRQPYRGRRMLQAQIDESLAGSARDWLEILNKDYQPDSILFSTSSKAHLRVSTGARTG